MKKTLSSLAPSRPPGSWIMGRPKNSTIASRKNGGRKSKPIKKRKPKPAKKRIPVLVLDARCDDKGRHVPGPLIAKIEMLPPTPKGSLRAAEVAATAHCFRFERHVRFEDSPPAVEKKQPTTTLEVSQQRQEENLKAFRWLKTLSNDPELRGAKLRSLAKRAGLECSV